VKEHCEIRRWVLRPVEMKGCDRLIGLGGEGDGQRLRCIGNVGLPFCGSGAVDGTDGELAGLEIIGGAGGEALCYVVFHGSHVGDVSVWKCKGTVGGKLIGCGCVVADLDGNTGVGVGCVGGDVRGWETGEGCVGLVGHGGDGPAVPVDGAVFEVGDLRWEGRVDV